jgi:hypothetical protein
MKKKVFFGLILLFFTVCSKNRNALKDRFDYIPQETILVVQVNDFNIVKNTFTSQPLLSQLKPLFDFVAKPLLNLSDKMENKQSLFCLTPQGQSSLAFSLIYKKELQDSLAQAYDKSMQYENLTIGVFQREGMTYYETQMGDVFFISDSQLVLENSIRNYKNKVAGINSSDFFKLTKTFDNNAPLQVLLHNDADSFLEYIFPKTPYFPSVSSSWTAFDFNTQRDPFTLDGVSFINDSIAHPINFIKGLGSQKFLSPEVSPKKVDSYFGLAVEDMQTLEDNFKHFSRLQNIALSNIDFSPLAVVDEIGCIRIRESDATILHLKNTENISSSLFNTNDPEKSFRSIPFYPQNLKTDFNTFLTTLGNKNSMQWGAKMDDFLVFTSSEELMKTIISAYKDGNVLANDFRYKSLMDALANQSNFLWLGNTEELQKHWKNKTTKRLKDVWGSLTLSKYPWLALQGVGEEGFVQMRFTAQKDNPEMIQNSVVNQYSFQLEAPSLRAPQWIKNHRTKAMDLVLQDQENQLYLFSNTGTLYWKKQLSGPIQGPIQQVDLYKNRRLQMAYRTPNRFQILDRNGKVVPPFDMKMNDSETPLAVFDYDRNRNYRFVLTNGNTIKMLDNKGSVVKGFELKNLNKALMHPLKHIRIGDKDYIIQQNVDGTLRILNRQGKNRVRLKEKVSTSFNPVFNYRETITTTDANGQLLQIDQKGNVVRTPLDLKPGHQIDMSTKSLIALSENILTIKGIPVTLPYGNYTSPKLFYLQNKLYITTTDKEAEKVYLYYSNGLPVEGFPMYGIGPADLTNADDDKALELVVQVDTNGYMIYQIN